MLRLHRQLGAFLGAREDELISVFERAGMKFNADSDAALRNQNARFRGAPKLPDGLSGAALLAQCVVNAEMVTGSLRDTTVVNFYRQAVEGNGGAGVFEFYLSGSSLANIDTFRSFCESFMRVLYPTGIGSVDAVHMDVSKSNMARIERTDWLKVSYLFHLDSSGHLHLGVGSR